MKTVAIIGATGFIGKSLAFEYGAQKRKESILLFSRNKDKASSVFRGLSNAQVCSLDEFGSHAYDVVVNCSGIGDPNAVAYNGEIFSVTESVDALIINYLRKHKKTIYINLSSGAAYGHVFTKEATKDTTTNIPLNALTALDYYSIAKLHAEAKHRSLKDLSIVDIRIFAFFSRFVNPKTGFLMSEIVGCLQTKTPFITTDIDVIRDYATPRDLIRMIDCIAKRKVINDVFDIYSKAPVSKLKLLSVLAKKYGLKSTIKKMSKKRALSTRSVYASLYKKAKTIGYIPEHSSLESIDIELSALFGAKK